MKQAIYTFICFNLLSFGLFGQSTITYGGRGIKAYQVISSDQVKLNLGYNLTKLNYFWSLPYFFAGFMVIILLSILWS